ncbi:cupin domain-containing protein [Amycolatopsis sp. lyj-109]|uniref:cupin domain-containing protein n=1 Tax=Amycolatopsis sp. lyj-109 TaxID=2789287 RepID=UPI00397D79E6
MSMPQPFTRRLVQPDEGELLHAAGGVVNRVLEDGSVVGRRLGVLECRLPAGWAGPPQHVHRAHDETFYVVQGTVRFASADLVADVSAGGFFSAPMGTPHGFGNAAGEPALMLCTVSPQKYIDYFRELQALTRGSARLDRDVLAELMERFATELYPGAEPS